MKKLLTAAIAGLATVAGLFAATDDQPAMGDAVRPTLTLSPAVVMVKGRPRQAWTQTLRMSNLTPAAFHFDVEVQDVVVKDGVRTFVPAGETEGGIAITAVTSPQSIAIAPKEDGTVTVTLTVPPQTPQRAVVVYFRGKIDTPSEDGSVSLGASLGALITFALTDQYKVEVLKFNTGQQSETTNLTISQELLNSGTEPVIPKGATAILDDEGRRVSKATFEPRRLLPKERLVFTATNPSQLRPGHYRVISSFEYEGKIVTAGGEIVVP